MELSALIIAIVSIIMSAMAIGWQVATYLLTGARVRIETRLGALGPAGLVTWDRAPKSWEIDQVTQYGPMQPIVAVRVRNVGRGSTSVEGVGVEVGDGITFRQISGVPNPDLPARLEGHSMQTFLLDAQEVAAGHRAAAASNLASKGGGRLRGVAELGNGRAVKDRDGLPATLLGTG